jgi:hypothetical protein
MTQTRRQRSPILATRSRTLSAGYRFHGQSQTQRTLQAEKTMT